MESKSDKNLEQQEENTYLSKIQEDEICRKIKSEKNITEYKLQQNKILSFGPFKIKFLFVYFFLQKKPFKFRSISICGASPGINGFFSSLLFFIMSLQSKKEIKKIFEKKLKEKIRVIKASKIFYYFMIFIILSIINKNNSQEIDDKSYSHITMKMSAGYHRIISEKVSEYECKTEFTKPNEIYINGKNQSII